jgi:hypothetical protein
MDRRIFHGNISPDTIAQALMGSFNQGNLQTQMVGTENNVTIQIASSQWARAGGRTALTVNIQQIEDGVMVELGQQEWFGVAASLGKTVISAVLNPINLLGRLDDIAQDLTNIQLNDKIWQVVESTAQSAGASRELTERLTTVVCEFCGSANPVGVSACMACGAPLGKKQPTSCLKCGYVLEHDEKFCPNCGQAIKS